LPLPENCAYDANGNATSRQGNSITWSSYNYPVTVNAGSGSTAETVAFEYGPNRQRWQQSYSGNGTTETTDYVGGLLEVVLSGSTTTFRHYIKAGGEPVAVYAISSAGNTLSYVLSDHQGSVSDLTNSSGASVVNESFTPFGQRRSPTTWSGAASTSDLTTAAGITRQAYSFQTQLGLWMGMNHMNGRVEDAVTGRMLSADPHIPDRTNAQSYNRYSYVNNNPLTMVDPSGFRAGVYCLVICATGGSESGESNGDADDSFGGDFGFGDDYAGSAAYAQNQSFDSFVAGIAQWNSAAASVIASSSDSSDSSAPSNSSFGADFNASLNAAASNGLADLTAPADTDENVGPPDSAPPPTVPPYQNADGSWTITVTANAPSYLSTIWAEATTDPLFYFAVQPAFGFMDCTGGFCSNAQTLWRFTGAARTAFGWGKGGSALSMGLSTIRQYAPSVVASALISSASDGITTWAVDAGIEGAETIESLMDMADYELGWAEDTIWRNPFRR
jgi:RHS repeat-associated protein